MPIVVRNHIAGICFGSPVYIQEFLNTEKGA